MQHSILLYVKDPLASAMFYQKVLDDAALEASPGFAMFMLNAGTMLGLWNRDGVEPAPMLQPGSAEIGFHVASNEEVEALQQKWKSHNIPIIQSPTLMDFGYTFTAVDPDGHRLRVFATPS
ncbi:MAG: VOC family protein [Alphaproteobacteria bacterium]|nr:VOC family protein [Alphaproteobacteria bacterium]